MVWRNASGQAHISWQLFGIPIYIDPSWFVVVVFMTWSLAHGYFPTAVPGLTPALYWPMGLVAALLLFACVLLHELGHSLMARRLGIPVARVTLFIFGGVAHIAHDPRRPLAELTIALAGPLVSVLIVVGCFTATRMVAIHSHWSSMVVAILRYLAMINLALVLFNLLPGFPLDGGRLVRAALWAWTGSLRTATRVASWIGATLGLALLVLGVWAIIKGVWVGGLWYVVLGFFLRDAALASYRQARAQRS